MRITLNCIMVAIATGLLTVIMLVAAVLLINSRATVTAEPAQPRPCADVAAACLADDNEENNDDVHL